MEIKQLFNSFFQKEAPKEEAPAVANVPMINTLTPNMALSVSAVYACVGLLAETIAQLPIRIVKKLPDGTSEEVTDDPLYKLLYIAPNSWQTSFEFREMAMQHLCLHGNFYALKVKDNSGRVRELLPINPQCVSVKQNPDWSLEYTISDGKVYRTCSPDDVFHIRYRSLDGFRGISPIAFNRATVDLALQMGKHGLNVFKNSAQPSGILSHPAHLKAETAKRLKESWMEAYGGDGAGGIAVLEEGMTYSPVSMTQEDAQYIQTREFSVEEIARIFRVPLHEIQSTQKSTSWGSGIEAMNIGFVTRTILPWVKRWETAIQRDLIGDPDVQVKFNLEGLLRGDVRTRYEAYKIAINNGFMSPNEARAKEDMKPREGGDDFMTPLNMRLTDEDGYSYIVEEGDDGED